MLARTSVRSARFVSATQQGLRHSQPTRRYASNLSKPRIAERSIWDSIIPRALRERKPTAPGSAKGPSASASEEWNPATFFIVIFLIIGSNAINLIAVRTAAKNFSSKAESRIATLKEAIDRVYRGEDIDVKKLLGTDEEQQEQEWEDAMREIESALRSKNDEVPAVEPEATKPPSQSPTNARKTPEASDRGSTQAQDGSKTNFQPRFL